jgi:hypothetical protein
MHAEYFMMNMNKYLSLHDVWSVRGYGLCAMKKEISPYQIIQRQSQVLQSRCQESTLQGSELVL